MSLELGEEKVRRGLQLLRERFRAFDFLLLRQFHPNILYKRKTTADTPTGPAAEAHDTSSKTDPRG